MGMMSLVVIAAGLLGCGLITAALVGVAWAIYSNRRPPSGH
jgi:hypothetical protein